ncbi:hypothetical protein AX16_000032 [Volvariella volvacea WC 439]|nr:hypothetical protein AX16_000032 [Volvariella volvacea WC 439]
MDLDKLADSFITPRPLTDEEQKAKLAEFDSVPLFMKQLPTEGNDDFVVAALQSLAYDGTPDEIAQNFKEQGNEYFKGKRYREALGFYTQGIDAKPTDKLLQEALLCNRAACNLELQNYGSVLRDCSKVITLNVRSSKAYYRSAVALNALERYQEAIDCCIRCLAFDPGNNAIKALHEKARKEKEIQDEKERIKGERSRKEDEAKRKLMLAFRDRNILPISNPNGSRNPYAPEWDPEDPTEGTLLIPVFFLYPQYATSDIIPNFVEDTTFSAHLENMFPPNSPPPDWDVENEYVNGSLVIYAMTHRKRLLKVGKKMTLRDVCKAAKEKKGEPRDGLPLKDGCLTFVVLPRGDVELRWVEEYKASRDAD